MLSLLLLLVHEECKREHLQFLPTYSSILSFHFENDTNIIYEAVTTSNLVTSTAYCVCCFRVDPVYLAWLLEAAPYFSFFLMRMHTQTLLIL